MAEVGDVGEVAEVGVVEVPASVGFSSACDASPSAETFDKFPVKKNLKMN
jgi:hypothetical protein